MDRLSLRETFGLTPPLSERLREVAIAARGDGAVPPSRFDASSLGIFKPRLAVKTWLGWRPPGGRLPVTNLFNRTPTPVEQGWSVRRTQVRDHRGGDLTYDSHNGTDFGIPVGTRVVAAAAGVVLRVSSELHRGGLKVFIDHGRGLVTTSNHLGRALVRPGDRVRRGQVIALSAYSGLDAIVSFPWVVPHVHFNVWLDGESVDPFACGDETPIWLHGNDAQSDDGGSSEDLAPTPWDPTRVAAAIDACRDAGVRGELRATRDLGERAMGVLFQQSYFPARFAERVPLYTEAHAREARLTLPFSREDYTRVWMVDEPLSP
ncbi:MAG: M23 family metallopeptidase [Polyangiaceae bacterium]|nr:M23 family metallopeptidase [Polyangiaceae bacterium]